jgi:hypothetical protein
MKGHVSEQALEAYSQLVAQSQGLDFSEGDTYDFTRCVRPNGTAYGTRGTCRKGSQQEKQAAPAKGEKSRSPVDHNARLAKHATAYKAAQEAHAASKAALAASKGRDKQSRVKRQLLAAQHDQNMDKLAAALDRLVRAKAAKNKSGTKE